MDFERLADIIARFNDVNFDLLINAIELLEGRRDVKTVNDLTNYLEKELRYYEI